MLDPTRQFHEQIREQQEKLDVLVEADEFEFEVGTVSHPSGIGCSGADQMLYRTSEAGELIAQEGACEVGP